MAVVGETHVSYYGEISSPLSVFIDGPSDIEFKNAQSIGSLSLKNGARFMSDTMRFSGGKRSLTQNQVPSQDAGIVEYPSPKKNTHVFDDLGILLNATHEYVEMTTNIAAEPEDQQSVLIKRLLNTAMHRVVTWEEKRGDIWYTYKGPKDLSYIAFRSVFGEGSALAIMFLGIIVSAAIAVGASQERVVARRIHLVDNFYLETYQHEVTYRAFERNVGIPALLGMFGVSALISLALYLSRYYVDPSDQAIVGDMFKNVRNIVGALSHYNLVSDDFQDKWEETIDEVEFEWGKGNLIGGNAKFLEFYKYTQQ